MSHMGDEIEQIPEVVERLLSRGTPAVRDAAAAISRTNPTWISIVARGTSDHVAVYARYLIEATLGIPVVLAAPSISTLYGNGTSWDNGLLLAISQSGQSPDLLSVVASARAGGAVTIAVTNDADSPLADACHHVIDCHAGNERSVAATKSYVAGLTAVAMLVSQIRPGAVDVGFLPALLARSVDESRRWLDDGGVVDSFARSAGSLVVGRGFNMSTALEVALKLIETSKRFAIGYSAADLEHGPIVLGADGTPVLVFLPPGDGRLHLSRLVERLSSRGADVWSVTARPSRHPEMSTRTMTISGTVSNELSPIPFVIPGLLLAESVATSLGLDPDAPSGLSKVTLTL